MSDSDPLPVVGRDSDPQPVPDAHGQAALLLLESLIHTLVDNGTLSAEGARETLASAVEVKQESAEGDAEPRAVMEHSLLLLRQIASSIDVKLGLIGDA